VQQAVMAHGLSERQACRVLGLSRSVYRYQSRRRDETDIHLELRQLAYQYPRWGFGKMRDYFRYRRSPNNHKRLHRIYCELGLNLRVKPKKRLPRRVAQPLTSPLQPNVCWSIDFMSDSLQSGRAFRTFNILDDFNRAALRIEVDTSFPTVRVSRVLDQIAEERGYPQQVRLDNGPEFIAHRLEQWAQQHQVELKFIQPGKPAQNAYIERFNRTYRTEVLDAYWFSSLHEVREVTEAWLTEYNDIRPHEALGGVPPNQYAR
jgi:putative transposase